MHKKLRSGVILLACSSLPGCADLTVKHLDTNSNSALKGQITYFLPRTVFNVAMSVSVTKCDNIDSSPPDETSVPAPDPEELKLSVAGTATPVAQADPQFGYRIDYRDAETWTKEIQFAVNTTPNKVLSTFNATINDQAGPILVSALSAAVQIAGATLIPGVHTLGGSTPNPNLALAAITNAQKICSNGVDTALIAVRNDKAQIAKLKAIIAAHYDQLAAGHVQPGKDDPTTVWSQAITALTGDISTQQAKLTYSWTAVWIPDASDFVPDKSVDNATTPLVAVHQFPISPYVIESGLLNEKNTDYITAYQADPIQGANGNMVAWTALHQPLVMKLVIDPTTFFDAAQYQPSTDLPTNPLKEAEPGGLLVRDPATGILQPCTPQQKPAPALVRSADNQAAWVFPEKSPTDLVKLCPTPSLTQTGGYGKTAAKDDAKRISVSLPQAGRPLVLTAHSAMWENATLSVALNPDGSLQSVGTHDTSTAATGLSGIATAAGAAAQAETARNTAITAGNTVTTTKLQLSDTINKAVADCYTQAAAITKAGGTPVQCQ